VVSPDARPHAAPTAPDRPLTARRSRPILVTGVPRSGTTWLARELAVARGAALPGREPMNPRGEQFALGGTLTGWTELRSLSARQERLLRRCYRGLEPRTFSRYGMHQWRALLPGTRTIIKDPFALLSVPVIVACTGALPIVVYRHPGAVLASYRRMGWTADVAEVRSLQGADPQPAPPDDAHAMVEFWTFLHRRVLAWLPAVPEALLVSHAEVSLGGPPALGRLMAACGLRTGASPSVGAGPGRTPREGQLHSFDRSAAEVSGGWRSRLTPAEVALVEEGTAGTWQELQSRRWEPS
jgi:hypothetical protein